VQGEVCSSTGSVPCCPGLKCIPSTMLLDGGRLPDRCY
jgi:hypothetical protein